MEYCNSNNYNTVSNFYTYYNYRSNITSKKTSHKFNLYFDYSYVCFNLSMVISYFKSNKEVN